MAGVECGLDNERLGRRLRVGAIVAVIGAAAAMWGVGQVVIRVHRQSVSQAELELQRLKEQAQLEPRLKKTLIDALKARDRARQRRDEARRRVPAEPDRAELPGQLLQLAESHGLQLEGLRELPAPAKTEVPALWFEIVAVAPYEDLARWLWDLEHLERYVRVTELQIQADNNKCRLTMRIMAPYGLDSSPSPRRSGRMVARAGAHLSESPRP